MLERFDDGFNNNDQQDAAEFLQVFLRAIGGEIGGNTFEGEETIYRTCLACNEVCIITYTATEYDAFIN